MTNVNPFLINRQISQAIKRLSREDKELFAKVIFQFLADADECNSLTLAAKYTPLLGVSHV